MHRLLKSMRKKKCNGGRNISAREEFVMVKPKNLRLFNAKVVFEVHQYYPFSRYVKIVGHGGKETLSNCDSNLLASR